MIVRERADDRRRGVVSWMAAVAMLAAFAATASCFVTPAGPSAGGCTCDTTYGCDGCGCEPVQECT
jgi:hypothetical protein